MSVRGPHVMVWERGVLSEPLTLGQGPAMDCPWPAFGPYKHGQCNTPCHARLRTRSSPEPSQVQQIVCAPSPALHIVL